MHVLQRRWNTVLLFCFGACWKMTSGSVIESKYSIIISIMMDFSKISFMHGTINTGPT